MTVKKLTPKQQKFIERYCIHGNGTRAAKEADYKGNDVTLGQVAAENLKKPQIAECIKQYQDETSKRNKVDADFVLKGLADLASHSSSDAVRASSYNTLSKILGMQNHEKKINVSGNAHIAVVDAIDKLKKSKENE